LYRIISFWGYLPVGWLAWAGLTWHNRREDKLVESRAEVPPVHQVASGLTPDPSAELSG
jgi:hypothetical protein